MVKISSHILAFEVEKFEHIVSLQPSVFGVFDAWQKMKSLSKNLVPTKSKSMFIKLLYVCVFLICCYWGFVSVSIFQNSQDIDDYDMIPITQTSQQVTIFKFIQFYLVKH